ncbi:MAG: phenylalanine--tRNA ligase subunit beta [Pyrinomonadaceae bacterium]|nr:phenylalanine--tRNA ligase subunit beta [Pyrinomonadaceae bacterium]
MDISYNWLRDLVETDLTADEVAAELTRVGLAVEGIHAHGCDLVFDIDLTSNRPDCLSHLGVAREIAVNQDLEIATGSSDAVADAAPNLVSIVHPELCYRFTARIIRNVKIGPSPQWLVDRLEAIGERSINNVADITNYVMHELGQPMHSFDLDKLTDNRIVVRRAKAGETIQTLDDVERKLDESMLVICDAEKPAAIGGIMGGLDSSITESTVNVLLEVAYFDRANIRSTSRKLNLATEASYRFERGVDIENLIRASNRAAKLTQELAGGTLGEFINVYPTKSTPKTVESPDISAAVQRLTGLTIETNECVRILSALGIMPVDRSQIPNLRSQIFVSPSWRHDIAIEEDLVEEIARHAGYENIAAELPPVFGAGEYQPNEPREKRLRRVLADMGFDEALSYSFIDTRHDEIFETVPNLVDSDLTVQFITLQDAVIDGAVRMRPSILPGLLDAVRLNLNHQRRDIKLFELGKVFAAAAGEDSPPKEQKLLAIALIGGEIRQNKAISERDLDFYDAKGSIEAALAAVSVDNVSFIPAVVRHLRQGQAARIQVDGRDVGSVGRLNDDLATTYKFRQSIFVAEIDLQTVLSIEQAPLAYRPLSIYPGIVRDISFVVGRNVSFDDIRDSVAEMNFALCRSTTYVDIYEGKGLAEGERSLTIRLEYRSDERTLVEQEVEDVHSQIVVGVGKKLGISYRV